MSINTIAAFYTRRSSTRRTASWLIRLRTRFI